MGTSQISWNRQNLNVPIHRLKAFGSNIFDTARGQRADRLQWLDHCKKILERRKRNQLLFSHCWPEFELGTDVVNFAAKVHRKTCFSGFLAEWGVEILLGVAARNQVLHPAECCFLQGPWQVSSLWAAKSEQLKPRRSGKFMPLHSKKASFLFQGLNPPALEKNQGEIPENERTGFWNAALGCTRSSNEQFQFYLTWARMLSLFGEFCMTHFCFVRHMLHFGCFLLTSFRYPETICVHP